jgi:outer membrane protein OmpA-like peptidoglycan-associated protein
MRKANLTILAGVLVLALSACASSQLSVERDELTAARTAIEQARAVKAEQCAPKLLALAQSSLYWAAHELSEGNSLDEAAGLITQSEKYARQARDAAISNCKDATTVILMPDEDGKVGTLAVKAGEKAQTINQAFQYTTASGKASKLEPAKIMDEKQFNKQFSGILASQPPKPAHFILYFVSGSTNLTEESKALIPQVLKAAKERQPSEVSIVGHSDATGSARINLKISSERAQAVEKLLKSTDSAPASIYLRFHGENDPLVPTPDNVPEPKNRRVEIMIL